MKRALITGITGQDGSYLAELLLAKPEYEVHGLVRRSSTLNRQRIDHLFARDPSVKDRLSLHYADLHDSSSMATVMEQVRPEEVYNLGAQSHVRVSFDQPLYTADVVGLGTLRLLEATRRLARVQPVKFYQASSSEMYGAAPPPQGPDTPFHPRSPMPAPSSMPTGRPSTIAKPMGSSRARGSCSITRARAGASRSSRARSPWARRASRRACKRSS
jgi:GDPmannose 4,6-dehydratase